MSQNDINYDNLVYITTESHNNIDIPAKPSLNSPSALKSRKGLGFIHLNIRSLLKQEKLDHVKILVSETDADVVVLTESWLL